MDTQGNDILGVQNPSFEPDMFYKDRGTSAKAENENTSEERLDAAYLRRSGRKLCFDRVRKRKIQHTVILLMIYATAGLVYGQLGPSLPDLQKISGVQLEKASWIFTGYGIGYLVGCLAGGILLEKFHPYLLLFLYTIGVAVTTALLPWIPELVVMVFLRMGTGFGIGGQDTCVHTMLLGIWQNQGGRFIHVTHIQIAVGGILSPLITEPFVSSNSPENVIGARINGTAHEYNRSSTINITNNSLATNNSISDHKSTIHHAFLITAIITAAAAFPSLYIYFTEKDGKIERQINEDGTRKSVLPARTRMIILGILYVNSFFSTACIDLFPSFLTTFLIEQLTWTQRKGAVLTSIYFGTYGLGNLVAAVTHSYIRTTTIIVLSYSTTLVSLVALLLSVLFEQTFPLWISVAITGLTSSVILPTLFPWIQENITPVTGRIASALLFFGSAGVMANPPLLGYIMDNFTPMWFLFLSIGETLLCALLFAFAFGVFKTYSRSVQRESSVNTGR